MNITRHYFSNVLLGFWIYLLLWQVKCLASKYVSNSKQFSVKHDVRLGHNTDIIAVITVKSSRACASQCTTDSRCCAADYENKTGKCTMHSFCCTYSMKFHTVVGTNVFLKLAAQDNRINDCSNLPSGSPSQIYTVYPNCGALIDVYCEKDATMSAWTVVQRRYNGFTNFDRQWNDYKAGFGDKNGEFWIGNENLHTLTSQKPYKLRIVLKSQSNEEVYAEYSNFYVNDETNDYRLTVSGYTGTAGNGMNDAWGISLNGFGFTTRDRDNDFNLLFNCAAVKKGGWWHRDCTSANLNGEYRNPTIFDIIPTLMYWHPFKGYDLLKQSKMLIKPA